MQLYKNFFKLIRANKFTVILYSVIMLAYTISMIYAGPYQIDKGSDKATEKSVSYKNLGVLFRDNDNSELSRGVKVFLESFGVVDEDNTSSEESINEILYFSISDYYIEVPEGFQKAVEAGEDASLIYSSHSQVSGKTFSFVNDIDSFVNIYRSYRSMGMDDASSVKKALELSSSEVTFGVVTEKTEAAHGTAHEYTVYMVLLYFCYCALCLLGVAVAGVIISSNKKEISNRIDASPVKPARRMGSQLAGLMTIAAVIVLIFSIFSFTYAAGSEMITKYGWAVVLNLITTIFYICGFTLLVSSFRLGASALNLICNSMGLAMCFLCGIFVPFQYLPSNVQNFAQILPFFWSGKILNTIYRGSGMNYTFSTGSIFVSLGIQVLFGLAFIMMAMVIKKAKQGKAA